MNTQYLPFVGRVLIGVPFAMSGLSKLTAYSTTAAMIVAAGLPSRHSRLRWPWSSSSVAGLLLVFGYHTRSVALVLAVFCFATAISFHNNFTDQNQMIHFLKNVMIAGGLLQIAAFGAGAISIEQWRRKSGTAFASTTTAA